MTDLERYRDAARGMAKIAVGHTLPGLLAEYVLIGEEVLAAGCLLPLPDASLPAAHAAIAEPVSCVISSHAHHLHLVQPDPRHARTAMSGLRPGGVVVVIGAGPDGPAARGPGVLRRGRERSSSRLGASERLAWIIETFGSRAAALGVSLETVEAGIGRSGRRRRPCQRWPRRR